MIRDKILKLLLFSICFAAFGINFVCAVRPSARICREGTSYYKARISKSTRKTVLIMYGIDALCAAISIFYTLGDNHLAIILYIILLIVLVTLIMKTDILFQHIKKEPNKKTSKMKFTKK